MTSIRSFIRIVENGRQASPAMLDAVWAEVEASGTVTDRIAEYEAAWRGGIANFGDKRAGVFVSSLPEYEPYRAALVGAIQHHIGFPFAAYRVMPEQAFHDFSESASSEVWATSLSERVARGFLRFAGHRQTGPMILLRIAVQHPEAIIMRGKRDEQEIVINPYHAADWIEEPHFTVIERFGR